MICNIVDLKALHWFNLSLLIFREGMNSAITLLIQLACLCDPSLKREWIHLGRVTSAATCVGKCSWASQTLYHGEEEMINNSRNKKNVLLAGLGRSGHVRSQSFGPISDVSGSKLNF